MTNPVAEVAQGIAVAGQKAGTTFGDLFFGTYDSPWALVAVALASAFAGMFSHWMKKFYTEEDTASFYEWFFINNRRGTMVAVFSMLGALFAVFGPLDYTTVSSYQVFTQAWAVGYAADSVFNSNSPRKFRTRHTMESEIPEQIPNPALLPGGDPGPNNAP